MYLDKEDVVYIICTMEHYSVIEKNGIFHLQQHAWT